mmetsp:Transcript_9783/g.22318  ORF Transcript_9783/g.22318 Transcript_9783/m.22318 type:complete len:200 (+) Transcript_9783:1516-2115(+)
MSLALSWFAFSPVTLMVAGVSSSSFRMMLTLIFVPVSVSILCTFFPLAPMSARALSLSMVILGAVLVAGAAEFELVVAPSSGMDSLICATHAWTSFAPPYTVTWFFSLCKKTLLNSLSIFRALACCWPMTNAACFGVTVMTLRSERSRDLSACTHEDTSGSTPRTMSILGGGAGVPLPLPFMPSGRSMTTPYCFSNFAL